MRDWYLEIDFPTIVVFLSVIATLILQLLLCFKAKKIFIKLLPIALFIVSTIVFFDLQHHHKLLGCIRLSFLCPFIFWVDFGMWPWLGVWAITRKRN